MADYPISVLIFTLDEQVHLPICLEALRWCSDVIVVDSFSNDNTEAVCRSYGARFFQHEFSGFGDQRNWALDNCELRFDWFLVLDADERVTVDLVEEMKHVAARNPSGIGAFRVRRRFYIWGQWLRYSSLYPTWVVRFARKDCIRYVNRGHAETQIVKGAIGSLENDLIDENLKGIDEWFARQNRYSRKEAEVMSLSYQENLWTEFFTLDPLRRRNGLKRIFCRLPGRPFFYFIYAYFVRGGFREGRAGFVFCMMRAIYEGMLEAKLYDLGRAGRLNRSSES